ncbi:putative secreted protein (Por secretion system target) [Gillisia sp. Hel_I_86]|uniref:HYR domain-containing protein n=1 Tax=Gillisia sp. Hel_I_86 TaxID=1249981 RepID=UPI001199F48A|nr:HYR domain-containing protein [Gillisia sp. Hel_I_86]TVZ27339.1 putative secreted protein (Por secretion system target) [Gillisia sp. Hel_I_86]
MGKITPRVKIILLYLFFVGAFFNSYAISNSYFLTLPETDAHISVFKVSSKEASSSSRDFNESSSPLKEGGNYLNFLKQISYRLNPYSVRYYLKTNFKKKIQSHFSSGLMLSKAHDFLERTSYSGSCDNDTINPTLTPPANVTVNSDTNKCAASAVNLGTPTTNDNCGVKSVTNNAPATFPLGSTTVTWTVTDDSNNTTTATQTVTVKDNQNPTIAPPANVTVNSDTNKCAASAVNLGTPTTNDNCGVKNVTNNAPATFPLGSTTVTWTVTDDSNNTTTATQTVTVKDNQNPTITPPANVTVNSDTNKCTASAVNLGTPTTNDNCGVKNVTNNAPATFPLGATTVTWTVTDDSNNATTATQTVTVNDNQAPTLAPPANVTVNSDTNKCTASAVNLGTPATNDNCGVKSVTNNAPATFPLGSTTVTWTVTDDSNNATTATQTVTVKDNQNPTIAPPANVTVNSDTNKCTASAVNLGTPTTNDNCGVKSTTNNAPATFPLGSTTVTWTVTDDSNNATTATQTVTVNDNQAPVKPILSDIVDWSCSKQITDFPTTTDNCENLITGTTTDNLQFETFGEYSITWTFTDNSANSTTAVQKVIIPEPTVNQPNDIIVCNDETISTIGFSGSLVSGTTYNWINTDTSIGLQGSGIDNIASFTAINNTTDPVISTITVTPIANDCQGDPVSFSITINPTPTITKPADVVVCDGGTVEEIVLRGSSVNGTKRDWTNDNTAIGLGASGRNRVGSFVASNTTNQSIFATITIVPTANDCEGIPETFKIEVKPRPTVTAPEDQVYCNGILTNAIPLTGTPTGIIYDIKGGGAIGLSNKIGVAEIPAFTALNGSATIEITPKANGCSGDPVTYNITVNPTPTVSLTPPNQAICSVETTNISLSGPIEGSTFSWTIAEISPAGSITGATDGTGEKIQQLLTNTTNAVATIKYKITPVANNCDGTPITATITVNPTPVLQITIPECTESIDLTSPTIKTGNTTSGLTYTYWNDIDATIPLSNPSTVGKGTYYIKGTTSSGCYIIKEVVVIKLEPVIINFNDAPSQICSGSNFDFTPISNIENTSITWTRAAVGENPATQSDDKNIENPNETLLNTSSSTITAKYLFKLETDDGCINSREINVDILPEPQLTNNPIGDHCNGEQISHNLESNLNGTTITWRRDAFLGNPANTGSGNINEALYNDSGNTVGVTYYITLKSSEGCSSETQLSFPLLSGPKVTVTASSTEICPGGSVNLFSTFEGEASLSTTLIDENFNGNASNWAKLNRTTPSSSRTAAAWTLRPNNYDATYNIISSNDSSQFYLSNSDAAGSGSSTDTFLKFKNPINTVGYSSLTLSFWSFFRKYNTDDIAEVQVSTVNNDNDSNWTTIKSYTFNLNGVQSIDLSGYTGISTLYIRFRYKATWGYYMGIDNVKITGETKVPEVTWTSSTDPDWTSNEQNPNNVFPSETTVYTATYSDPDIECPGIGKVEVIVRQPPVVTITPNYCGDSTFIELVSDSEFSTYQWESGGEILGTGRSVDVELARTYTLTVTDSFGCSGIGSISVSDELLVNGDFESGTTGFYTEYTDQTGVSKSLYPEGYFAVDDNANFYHDNFYGKDHTTGSGDFMIINGHPGSGKVIWRQTITNIQPNTNYYFSAWGMNLNPANPARLQFQVNGVPTGTIADLKDAPKPTSNGQVNTNNWIQFYSNPFWNSGNATNAVLEIINLETIRSGNDFGLDDISFGTLEPIIFSIDPTNNSAICEGSTLELYANIEGGRDPIAFQWANANGIIVSTEENPILENLLATDSGTYTLTVTDAYDCSPQVGSTEVEIIPKTIVNAGEDQTVCAENALITLNGLVTGSISTGAWTGGEGTFNPNRNTLNATYTPSAGEISTGSVILILTSGTPVSPCTIAEDAFTLTINPTPIIDSIETIMPSCYQGSDGSAKAMLSSGTGTYSYLWSDGQTTQTATGLSKGGYSVIVTDEAGCSVTGNITIIEPSPLEIVASSFTPVQCFAGEDGTVSIEVTGGVLDGESPEYIITLLDKDGIEIFKAETNTTGAITVSNLTASTYTFTVTTPNACTSLSIALTVNQPDEIPANAGDDISIAECGTTTFNLNAAEIDPTAASGSWSITFPADGGGGTFSDDSARQSTFTGTANTSYTLRWTITPANGCPPIFDELDITFPPSCSKLDFDGIDDYVDFGDNFNLRNPENTFSLEAWVKPNSINGINTIISKRNLNDLAEGGYDLILNNGKPSFRLNNKTITTTKSIGTDRWYHLAAVQEGSVISLYVDGIKLKTDNLSTKPKNIDAPMLIGAMYDSANPLFPKNNFHGWIEEVRIWNTGLNQEQVRFMMNQRIQNNNGKVQGEIIPLDVPLGLLWNNLDGYYRMIVGEVNNGLTLDMASSGISGILKNIETTQENTAPLPYISNSDGKWFDNTSWLHSQVWDAPNSKGIDGSNINWNIAKISNNLNSDVKDLTLLGLISESNILTMGKQNNQNQGQGLIISHYLKLDGFIDLAGKSQLVQNEGSILDEASAGYIEIDQQGTASSYNYNYWSSPVSEQGKPNNAPFTIKNIVQDGSDPNNPVAMNFGNGVTYADGPFATPRKISNYWIYKFRGTANQYSEWQHIGSDGTLMSGEGYTMKGTSGDGKINEEQNYVFKGKPHNGTITLTIGKEQNYLLGNPYPSAMDAHEFLLDNIKANGGRNDVNIFNGALYFWDHFGGKTHVLREYIGGYATKNLIDAVPAISTDDRINSNGNRGVKKPEKYIPVGQGFFINTSLDPSLSENISVAGGNIVFKNSQRYFIPETPGNSQFLKPEKNNKETKGADVRAKIRLNFKSPMGYYRQILVGADVNATNGFDLGYDAPINDYNLEDMYWLINKYEFVIQGVPNFNKDQVLPIGIRLEQAGEFKILLDTTENIDPAQNIYLRDLVRDSIHNLKKTDYWANSPSGEIVDRFQIIFFNEADATPEIPIIDDLTDISLLHSYTENEMMVLNPEELRISAIYLFDLNGKLLSVFDDVPSEKEIILKVANFSEGIYILKMHTDNEIVTRKIIMKN